MRIPLDSARNVTAPERQPRPLTKQTQPPAAATPAVRVSLSRAALEASGKANPGAEAVYAGPAQRGVRNKGGVPHTTETTTGQTRGPILGLQKRLLKEHPNLREESRIAIETRLLQDHGLRLDADHTYFNVFRSAHSSGQTYNGWEHRGAPVMSLSLTELQMRNFPPDLGEDPNGLNANSGIYTEGFAGKSFGLGNEVRLLSTDLKRAVRANNVGDVYRDKLKAWWARNEQAVATLYQAQARKWRRHGGLSPEACAMLREVLRAADGKTVRGNVSAYAFDINSYASKDMTWFKGPESRVLMIMPGNAQPLREYRNLDAMRRAIEDMARTGAGRTELASHFSLYNRKDGTTYQGVEKWLGDIAAGGYRARIAYAPQRIEGNVFRDQAARTMAAELDDIKRLVKSNSEVIEEESTQFVRVLSQLFPEFFFPAKAVELALDVHQAIADGAAGDRQRAAQAAVGAGINLAAAAVLGALATPIRRASPPGTPAAAERAAYFNAPGRIGDGRIGYLLGPAEAPRPPSSVGEILDRLNEVDAAPGDWDDDAFSLAGTATPSSSSSTDVSLAGSADWTASDRSRSPSPAPHLGWWEPGQEPVMGEAPPPSPATPLPGLGVIGNHEGLPYLNALNWIERIDMPHVYRAVAIESLASRSPEVEGFESDMSISGGGVTINDRYLFTIESQDAAMNYGNATFGAGNFAVFRIDTDGVPAMPYRLNINYDMWSASPPVAEALSAGQQVTPDMQWLASYVHVTPAVPNEPPAGFQALGGEDIASYEGGYVFIDNRAVPPSRIHRVL